MRELEVPTLVPGLHVERVRADGARELPDRTTTHGAGPATTRTLRSQPAAPTGRLLTPRSGRYLPPYSYVRKLEN